MTVVTKHVAASWTTLESELVTWYIFGSLYLFAAIFFWDDLLEGFIFIQMVRVDNSTRAMCKRGPVVETQPSWCKHSILSQGTDTSNSCHVINYLSFLQIVFFQCLCFFTWIVWNCSTGSVVFVVAKEQRNRCHEFTTWKGFITLQPLSVVGAVLVGTGSPSQVNHDGWDQVRYGHKTKFVFELPLQRRDNEKNYFKVELAIAEKEPGCVSFFWHHANDCDMNKPRQYGLGPRLFV